MAHPSALDTLIELAASETDEAAKQLGRAVRAADDAAQKLALLVQYRDDYAARLQSGMGSGLNATAFRNFQVFIGKLDDAIAGQQEVVRQAQRHIEMRRGIWQQSERKRLSYGTLSSRARAAAAHKENKRDQKQMDEHAARQAFTRR